MSQQRNRILGRICKGAPLILIQLALFGWMIVFTVKGAFEEFRNHMFVAAIYSIVIGVIFAMVIASLLKTWGTLPGKVTPALIEKLKR